MECLDIDTFYRYLDHELDSDLSAAVAAHLDLCTNCANRLRALQEYDTTLSSIVPSPPAPATAGAGCYSVEQLCAYLSAVLSPQEAAHCEQHLHGCAACRREVIEVSRAMRLVEQAPLLTPPSSLVAAVQQTFTPPLLQTLGTLIIQVLRDGLKFIEARFVPEAVRIAIDEQLLPAGAFRKSAGSTEAFARLDIRQTLGALACHISAMPDEGGTVLLTVQLQKHGVPLAHRRVLLLRDDMIQHASTTPDRGVVSFRQLNPGEYTMQVREEKVETQVVLDAV